MIQLSKLIYFKGRVMPVPFSLKGYTYQQCIYMLCVALMDAKREITMIRTQSGNKRDIIDYRFYLDRV